MSPVQVTQANNPNEFRMSISMQQSRTKPFSRGNNRDQNNLKLPNGLGTKSNDSKERMLGSEGISL